MRDCELLIICCTRVYNLQHGCSHASVLLQLLTPISDESARMWNVRTLGNICIPYHIEHLIAARLDFSHIASETYVGCVAKLFPRGLETKTHTAMWDCELLIICCTRVYNLQHCCPHASVLLQLLTSISDEPARMWNVRTLWNICILYQIEHLIAARLDFPHIASETYVSCVTLKTWLQSLLHIDVDSWLQIKMHCIQFVGLDSCSLSACLIGCTFPEGGCSRFAIDAFDHLLYSANEQWWHQVCSYGAQTLEENECSP